MSNILVYALHYEGAFNKNSLGAVSEASRLADELGSEAHAVVIGEGISDELAATLGRYGAKRSSRPRAPRASRARSSTSWARSSTAAATSTPSSAAACWASRSAPAAPRASTPA